MRRSEKDTPQKRWRDRNREYLSDKSKAYQKANPDVNRRSWLKQRFGITLDQYDEMRGRQDGLCAICGRCPEKALDVDHCHRTGKIRGLLCGDCNRGLGLFRESECNLQNAIAYLQYHHWEEEETSEPPRPCAIS